MSANEQASIPSQFTVHLWLVGHIMLECPHGAWFLWIQSTMQELLVGQVRSLHLLWEQFSKVGSSSTGKVDSARGKIFIIPWSNSVCLPCTSWAHTCIGTWLTFRLWQAQYTSIFMVFTIVDKEAIAWAIYEFFPSPRQRTLSKSISPVPCLKVALEKPTAPVHN